jgi:hypothetical protein
MIREEVHDGGLLFAGGAKYAGRGPITRGRSSTQRGVAASNPKEANFASDFCIIA